MRSAPAPFRDEARALLVERGFDVPAVGGALAVDGSRAWWWVLFVVVDGAALVARLRRGDCLADAEGTITPLIWGFCAGWH